MALLSLFAFSCRELVQEKFPDFDPVPTVNAILIADEPIQISVSMAQKIDTMALKPVEHALVLLTTNGLQTDTLTFDSESGMYVCDELAKAGNNYSCEIEIPGYKTLTSFTSIPKAQKILNVEHIVWGGKNEEGTSFPTIKITFQNKPEEQQYFEIEVGRGYLDYIVDPVLLNEGIPMALFSNELIKDTCYTMTLNVMTGDSYNIYSRKQPYTILLKSINSDYYLYMKKYYLYNDAISSDGVFESKPVVQLYSNIINGLGIFAGYSYIVSDTIRPTNYESY